MADTPIFESPITRRYEPSHDADLTLADGSAATKMLVRAAPGAAAAERLGVTFGASRRLDDVLVCGQRPTEWLLVGDATAVESLVSGLDRTGHISLIDHTHARALFRLTGSDAPGVMEKICSIDWSDPMTPDGAVVSASVAKTNCDIVRNDVSGTRSYLIAVDRSFGQYLFDAILDAGTEFGIAVGA